jgi:coenzyme F420-reducing hydrogenase alpha subunit
MTPIPLEEPNRKELENKLMEMPDVEYEDYNDMKKARDYYMEKYNNLKKEEEDELIHKRMNNINTFQCCEGELYLRGSDEYGRDFQVVFDAYDFLNWIDTEDIEYIKEQLIKHIKTK